MPDKDDEDLRFPPLPDQTEEELADLLVGLALAERAE